MTTEAKSSRAGFAAKPTTGPMTGRARCMKPRQAGGTAGLLMRPGGPTPAPTLPPPAPPHLAPPRPPSQPLTSLAQGASCTAEESATVNTCPVWPVPLSPAACMRRAGGQAEPSMYLWRWGSKRVLAQTLSYTPRYYRCCHSPRPTSDALAHAQGTSHPTTACCAPATIPGAGQSR